MKGWPRDVRRVQGLGKYRGVLIGLLALLGLAVILFPGIVVGSWRQAALAAWVQPSPDYVEMALDSNVTVSITATNVVDLYAVQLRLGFDPTHVQVVDADPTQDGIQVGIGTILAGTDWQILHNTVDNAAGTIEVLASLTGGEQWFDGLGTLINATFRGVGSGTSALTMGEVIFSDRFGMNLEVGSEGGMLVVYDGATLTPSSTPTLTRTPTTTPTPSTTPTLGLGVSPTPPTARVVIIPASVIVPVGVSTTVDIRILGVVDLYGAEVHLTFDPSYVRVVDADPGMSGVQISLGDFPYPDYAPVNWADNSAGTIDYALTQLPFRPSVNGDGVMGRITFETVSDGISPVHFVQALLSDPNGIQIPSTTEDGEIRTGATPTPTLSPTPTMTPTPHLQQGTIVGQVTFQGRSLPPAPDWVSPLAVTLFTPGSSVPTYTFSTMCDQRGVFTVTNIVANTYHVKVRDLHSLWNLRRNEPISLGINSMNFGTLIEGDADANNLINILDFSILAGTYGTSAVDPLFDPRADFNSSGGINILDFSLLATNYGRAGDVILTATGLALDDQDAGDPLPRARATSDPARPISH
jgi:hypothetical protein